MESGSAWTYLLNSTTLTKDGLAITQIAFMQIFYVSQKSTGSMNKILAGGCLLLFYFQSGFSQSPQVNRNDFLKDTAILHATLVTNLDKVLTSKKEKDYEFNGIFKTELPGGTLVNDPVVLEVSGNFRLKFCYVPPIKIRFNINKSSVLSPLKQMKLVSTCKVSRDFDQYLLKEYIVYKIYNLITENSFYVRLVELTLQDSMGTKKPLTEFAFLLEDIKETASRNNCKVWKENKVQTKFIDRKQMTILSVFQYLIGNTDWGVSPNHNIRFIAPKADSSGILIAVPYDFDYSGMVNAFYAIPDENLKIENVRQRQYIGFVRSYPEMEEALNIFREKKKEIYALINQFSLLSPKNRKEMTDYLDEFYETISSPGKVKSDLIEGAAVR
jgi:hypothetical protein